MLEKVRYEVESIIVKPSALKKLGTDDDIDPDLDTIALVEYRDTKEDALKLGNEIYQRDVVAMKRSYWKVVTIQEQHYLPEDEDYPHFWDWQPFGVTEEIR